MALRRLTPAERARRILATREELEALVAEGAVAVDDAALARIRAHHDALLAGFATDQSVDLSREEERLSAGMRLATLLGAAALSTAWAMFVSSVWNDLGRTPRLLMVWGPVALLTPLVGVAMRRESSAYVANIVATVASIAAAVAGFATLRVFELPEARWPFLAYGVLALWLAYRHRLVLPLLVGITGVGAWLWSLESLLRGSPLSRGFEHAEPLILLGGAALAIAQTRLAEAPGFRRGYTLAGMTAVALPLLLLGLDASSSWFGRGDPVEGAYQVLGLVTFSGLVAWGLRRDDLMVARGAAGALVAYLFLRMFDWFWDAVPKWLFFLMMGGLAFAVLLVLRQVRSRVRR